MARMKKATAKKAAPKKVGKKPAPKRQASKEELTPVPTQQNPQPPMGTPPMGANGPMMRKGGKIKKAQGGGPVYETSPYTKAKQEKENKKTEYKKVTTTMKKAQGGTKFGMLSVKAGVDNNPKPTAADRIAGAKKNAGTAKSGTKIKKAMMGKTMMKSGGKMKTCKGGC